MGLRIRTQSNAPRPRRWVLLLLTALSLLPQWARAQDSDCDETQADCEAAPDRAWAAIKAYVSSPLRWNSTQWAEFGGAVAAIGVAHSLDSATRRHFTNNSPDALNSSNTHDISDALPAAALLVGTWGYANLIDDDAGRREVRTMLEAASLSVGANYVFKYAAGRQRPDQTTDPNRWFASGGSFPSLHSTFAFAIGTVLAESGNDEDRWVRRLLGYGVAGYTVYRRLDHNAHWLSDMVAGAALGAASAHFAMGRQHDAQTSLNIEPLRDGLMLSASAHLP